MMQQGHHQTLYYLTISQPRKMESQPQTSRGGSSKRPSSYVINLEAGHEPPDKRVLNPDIVINIHSDQVIMPPASEGQAVHKDTLDPLLQADVLSSDIDISNFNVDDFCIMGRDNRSQPLPFLPSTEPSYDVAALMGSYSEGTLSAYAVNVPPISEQDVDIGSYLSGIF
jgi:hypothetical protein